jgi:8-oxo-dGTP diphosphatase
MVEPTNEFGEPVADAYYIRRPGGYTIISNTAGEITVVSTRQGLFLPGGGQEGDETPEQAAVREAYEECGLLIRLRSNLGTADELIFDAEEATRYRKQCTFFSARIVQLEDRSEDDHVLMWMVPEEAAAQLRQGSQRWAVSQACLQKPD